jgi:Homeodomain-like domain
MPQSTFVELSPEEHRQVLAALRRARYGYLLALHILLLCATGRTPTDIAVVLFCSRSSVYRTVRTYRQGCHPQIMCLMCLWARPLVARRWSEWAWKLLINRCCPQP